MSNKFLRINLVLAALGIGWALFSRFSQASKPGSFLNLCKMLLRSICSPETLTNLEHLASAIGTPCMLVAMNWYVYDLSKKNSRLKNIYSTLLRSQYRHYGRWAVAFSFSIYFVHQIDKEFLTHGNRANQFAWDLGGMAIGLLIVLPFLRKHYGVLHSDDA